MNAASQASGVNFHPLSAQSGRRDQRPRRFYNLLFVSPCSSVVARLARALLNQHRGHKYRTFVATPVRRGPRDNEQPEREIDEYLHESSLNRDALEEVPALSFPAMDFVILLTDDDSAAEISRSWTGNPDIMKWRITRPSFEGDQKDRERSFRRTLCELETRLNLFFLVHEKSEREEAAATRSSFVPHRQLQAAWKGDRA
jgi:hypothetical protein